MAQCKTKDCKKEAVLMDACADCFNAEYDSKHRPDEHPGEKTSTVTKTGGKKICTSCDKGRVVHANELCHACNMAKHRKGKNVKLLDSS